MSSSMPRAAAAERMKAHGAPEAVQLAVTAGKASRFNTYASGPMLFGMIKRSFKIKTTVE